MRLAHKIEYPEKAGLLARNKPHADTLGFTGMTPDHGTVEEAPFGASIQISQDTVSIR